MENIRIYRVQGDRTSLVGFRESFHGARVCAARDFDLLALLAEIADEAAERGDFYTINGKRYVGRRLVDRSTWDSLNEMHLRAVKSELSRMQTRGNLVPLHQLPEDDVSSRHQPITIASIQ